MRITLYYRGPLRANGNAAHKHDLRLHFHSQLVVLWGQPPLSHSRDEAFDPNPPDLGVGMDEPGLAAMARMNQHPSLVVDRSGHSFVPLVAQRLHGIATLGVRLLRPEPPGHLITQGGDLDNRLKTLLDSLKIPDLNQLPEDTSSIPSPMLCLLQEDNLVTDVRVTADQLLEPNIQDNEVIAILEVTVRRTAETFYNSWMAT